MNSSLDGETNSEPPGRKTLEAERPHRTRRWWLRNALIAGVAITGVTACAFAPRILLDDELTPDTDLRVGAVEPIPDSENCFYLLEQAHRAFQPPKGDFDLHDLIALYQGTLDREAALELGATEGDARRVLDENASAFARLRQASLATGYLPPEPRLDGDTEFLGRHMDLAYLWSLRAREALASGRLRAAAHDVASVVQCGRRITAGSRSIHTYLCGMAFVLVALDLTDCIQRHPDVEPATLRGLLSALRPSAGGPDDLSAALRGDYAILVNTLSRDKVEEILAEGEPLPWYVYKPRRTRNRLSTEIRALIQRAEEPFEPRARKQAQIDNELIQKWSMYATGNFAGELLVQLVAAGLDKAAQQQRKLTLVINATRLNLALRAYEIENTRLPDALEELVPAYIASVPTDPFSGQPLRYAREKRCVYSVGTDGVDRGLARPRRRQGRRHRTHVPPRCSPRGVEEEPRGGRNAPPDPPIRNSS